MTHIFIKAFTHPTKNTQMHLQPLNNTYKKLYRETHTHFHKQSDFLVIHTYIHNYNYNDKKPEYNLITTETNIITQMHKNTKKHTQTY